MSELQDGRVIRARATEFVLPTVNDGFVLGRDSPIGHVALGRALNLLTAMPFEHVEMNDGVISDLLIRSSILRKLTVDQLRAFVSGEIRPVMGPEEILQLHLEVEVAAEKSL